MRKGERSGNIVSKDRTQKGDTIEMVSPDKLLTNAGRKSRTLIAELTGSYA